MSSEEGQGNVVIEEDYDKCEEEMRAFGIGSMRASVIVEEEEDHFSTECLSLSEEREEDEEDESGHHHHNHLLDPDHPPTTDVPKGVERGILLEEALDLSSTLSPVLPGSCNNSNSSASVPLKKRKISVDYYKLQMEELPPNQESSLEPPPSPPDHDQEDSGSLVDCDINVGSPGGTASGVNTLISESVKSSSSLVVEQGKEWPPPPVSMVVQSNDSWLGLAKSTGPKLKGMGCGRPGFITCSICNATKYYSHVQRRYGQFSCEPCSKFMKRFLRDPRVFSCHQSGDCRIGRPSGEQEPRGVSVNRCKACWLKICLEKFILDPGTRAVIEKYYSPRFNNENNTNNDSYSLSQNLPPPLPLPPQRKRKPKADVPPPAMSPAHFTKMTIGKGFVERKRMEGAPGSGPLCLTKKEVGKSEGKRNSLGSQPAITDYKAFSSKKFISSRRSSSPGENHFSDLYPENALFRADLYPGEQFISSEECGKCTYCSKGDKLSRPNVVVVKESCKYMTSILSSLLSSSKEEEMLPLTEGKNPENREKEKGPKVEKLVKNGAVPGIELTTKNSNAIINKTIKKNYLKKQLEHNKAIFKRQLSDFGSETSFLNEILNTNSPFL